MTSCSILCKPSIGCILLSKRSQWTHLNTILHYVVNNTLPIPLSTTDPYTHLSAVVHYVNIALHASYLVKGTHGQAPRLGCTMWSPDISARGVVIVQSFSVTAAPPWQALKPAASLTSKYHPPPPPPLCYSTQLPPSCARYVCITASLFDTCMDGDKYTHIYRERERGAIQLQLTKTDKTVAV